MKINTINGNIFHFIGDNLYELGSTFIRMEEFYESPFDAINGKYFTLDYYMDLYAESKGGKFSYFEDWYGFNIPGNSLLEFFEKFDGNLRAKEQYVRDVIQKYIEDNDANFYVIGSISSDSALRHEYAHANYYLNPKYREACDGIWDKFSSVAQANIADSLSMKGYAYSKTKDEAQAYFSTATVSELIDVLGFSEDRYPVKFVRQYQDNFETILPIIEVPLHE
jgi:hypothetical protein